MNIKHEGIKTSNKSTSCDNSQTEKNIFNASVGAAIHVIIVFIASLLYYVRECVSPPPPESILSILFKFTFFDFVFAFWIIAHILLIGFIQRMNSTSFTYCSCKECMPYDGFHNPRYYKSVVFRIAWFFCIPFIIPTITIMLVSSGLDRMYSSPGSDGVYASERKPFWVKIAHTIDVRFLKVACFFFIPLIAPSAIVMFFLSILYKMYNSTAHLLHDQVDDEALKAFLADKRDEWNQLGLTEKQIRKRELLFTLDVHWAKFVCWLQAESSKFGA